MHVKISSVKWRPFCPGGDELIWVISTKVYLRKYAHGLCFVVFYCRQVAAIFTLNTLRPRRNGRHFVDDIFKWIFLNEIVWILIKISLKFVPQGPINNIPALVQIMAWRRPGDKPLSGPMMVRLPTHICVSRPQWIKDNFSDKNVEQPYDYLNASQATLKNIGKWITQIH